MDIQEFKLDFGRNDSVSLCIEHLTLEGVILEIREHSLRLQVNGESYGPRTLDLSRIWSCHKIGTQLSSNISVELEKNPVAPEHSVSASNSPVAEGKLSTGFAALKARAEAVFAAPDDFFRLPDGLSFESYSDERKLKGQLANARNRFRSAKGKNDTFSLMKSIDELEIALQSFPMVGTVRKVLLLLKLFNNSDSAQRFSLLHEYFRHLEAVPDEFWECYAVAAYESGSLAPFFADADRFGDAEKVRSSVRILKDASSAIPEKTVSSVPSTPVAPVSPLPMVPAAPARHQDVKLKSFSELRASSFNDFRSGFAARNSVRVSPPEIMAFEEANAFVMAGRKEDAVALLAQKVKQYPGSVRLWDLYATQLCGLRRDEEAIFAYEHLIQIADTRARNHYIKQVTCLNRRKEMPPIPVDNTQDLFSLDFDVPQKDEDSVSDFLRQELEGWSITDAIILKNNGKVTWEDAKRLLDKAARARDKTFYARYPLFLEAAKAFSELPERGTTDERNYKYSLSCYAMQRAGSIVAKMRSVFGQPTLTSSQELAELCDSAVSYYIEGMNLAPETAKLSGVLLPSLTSYLEAQLLFFFRDSRLEFIRLFGEASQPKNFRVLITTILSSGNKELFALIWETMLTWRRNVRLWKGILALKSSDGPHRLFDYINVYPAAREHFRAYMLTELGEPKRQNERLTSLYVNTAKKRAEEYRQIGKLFDEMKDLPVTGDSVYFIDLWEMFEEFPRQTKALFLSEREAVEELVDILSKLRGYNSARGAARGDILVNARLKLSNSVSRPKGLRDRLEQTSSYWKRVALLPIVENCLKNIEGMEAMIQNARQPKLHISLEPEVFYAKTLAYSTSLRLHNSGPADAMNVPITVLVRTLAGQDLVTLSLHAPVVESAESVDMQLDIPDTIFSEDPSVHVDDVIIQIIAAEGTPYMASGSFSFDIDQGRSFSRQDLPWVTNAIPSKIFGRDELLDELESFLDKQGRTYTHMLYGVTRSGKSSILKFLRQRINGLVLPEDEAGRRIFCIDWQFNKCHEKGCTPDVLWKILMAQCVSDACACYLDDNVGMVADAPAGRAGDDEAEKTVAMVQKLLGRSYSKADWLRFIDDMNIGGLYPLFLIDEFTEYKDMFDADLVGRDFLSSMRDTALEGKATFFVAGTYDIRDLLTDDKYGITGQFANLKRHFVTNIKPEHAKELVTCFDRLTFTAQAQELIIHSAACRPYLLQIICSACGQYAADNRRSILGATEVERVLRALTGEAEQKGIESISDTAFNQNLIFTREDNRGAFPAVISLLCHKGRDGFLSYEELCRAWSSAGLQSSDLNTALNMLRDREVIMAQEDEGRQGYAMRVPLFSRWWKHAHPNLNFDLNSVIRP